MRMCQLWAQPVVTMHHYTYKASIVPGFGGSLVFSPSLVIVGEYFEKRRGLATGIAKAGAGAGAFLGPLLMIYLFEHYGFSGTLLIVGAVMFNSCVSGALYRPLEHKVQKHARSPLFKLASEVAECPAVEPMPNDGSRKDNTVACVNDISHVDRDGSDGNMPSRLRDLCQALDVSLWKDSCFVLYAASQGLSLMSNMSVSILIPAVTKDNGMSENDGAYVLSAMAAGDFAGRFTSGFFFDLSTVRRQRYRPFSASMLFMAVTIALWPFITSFVVVMVNAVFFGFFLGVSVAQRTNILCDLFGVDRLSGATVMSIAAMGVGVLIGPFIAGKKHSRHILVYSGFKITKFISVH